MSLLGGGSNSSIPSMSWDSVLDKRSRSRRPARSSGGTEPPDDPADEPDEQNESTGGAEESSPPVASPAASDTQPDSPDQPSEATPSPAAAEPGTPKPFSYQPEPSSISFESAPLRLDEPSDPPVAPSPLPVPDVAASTESPVPPAPTPASSAPPAAPSHEPAVAAASQAPTPAVDPAPVAAVPAPASPVPSAVPQQSAAATVPADPAGVSTVTATASPEVAPAPEAVPTPPPAQPLAAPSLPTVAAAASPAPATSNAGTTTPYSALIGEVTTPPRRKKKKSGGGFATLLFLIVLGGLVAGGIIYGRPYLFPEEWDESARDYAKDIEEIRGVSYTEPLLVVEEPTEDYRARVGNQLLGDWQDQQPMWRALGLAAPNVDRETLDELIADRSPALYYEADGQVYHDAALPTVDKDPVVYRAMAEVAIDQEFKLTPGAASRSLLAEAMTDAHVLQQATVIQEASQAPTSIRPTDDTPLASLPPVLDYRLFAPTVFAELLPAYNDVAPNPLVGITPEGAGPLFERELELAEPPALAAGEVAVGEPQAMSPSFWFMVFASHTTPDVAWALSNDLVSASLLEVSSGSDSCFYSTWTVTGASGPGALAISMSSWVAAASPALQATLPGNDGEALHMRSCDPGDAFTSTARTGVARDLIGYQATELAAVAGVIESGGAQVDIDQAMTDVGRIDAAGQVVALDDSATAKEIAAAAGRAVESIVGSPDDPANPTANATGGSADPAAVEQPADAAAIDPVTGLPIDPTAGAAEIDPATGLPVESPATGG